MAKSEENKRKERSRNTLIGYLLVSAVVGLDYTYMLTTLYLYLRDMVKTDKPVVYYGLIVASYIVSSTLFGWLSRKWVEQTRMMKAYINLILIIQIMGCLLYVVHFHIFFPWVGRFIAGIGQPFPSVATAEIIRIFDKEDSTRSLWWLASIYTIGGMVGPVIVLFFKNIDCYIDRLHITQLNALSLFMALLLMVTLVVVEFLIHDYSKEPDVASTAPVNTTVGSKKGSTVTDEEVENINLLNSDTETEGSSTTLYDIDVNVVLQGLVSNTDSLLMFISTLWFMYNLFSTLVLIPLIVLTLLKWSLTALAVVIIGDGMLYFFLLMIMSKYCTTDRAVYTMTVISIIAQLCMLAVIVAIVLLPRDFKRDVGLMLLLLLFGAFGWFIEEVLLSWMLVQMVPNNVQSTTISLRNAVSRFSEIAAAISAPIVLSYLDYWAYVLVGVVFLLLIVFLCRRHDLTNIRLIDFDDYENKDETR